MSSQAVTGPLSQKKLGVQEVVEYLSKNPEFFHSAPELLDVLSVPHPKTGKSISLLERQIHNLRTKKDALESRVDHMVSVAEINDEIFGKMHQMNRAMMAARTEQQAVDAIYQQLTDVFQVEQIALLTFELPEQSVIGVRQLGLSQEWASSIKSSLIYGQTRCGLVESKWQKGLFQSEHLMQSVCLLPLGEPESQRVWGALALGSTVDRFHQDLGTHFLNMMADLISARLTRIFTKP